jgi:hypothetical protein
MAEFGYHALERSALGFVLEDETWPVFLEWARGNHLSRESRDWLVSVPDLNALRLQWAAHSPDPLVRQWGEGH